MYFNRLLLALVLVISVGYSAASAQSGVLLFESFSTYNNGDLVGFRTGHLLPVRQ